MKIKYVTKRLGAAKQKLVDGSNVIIAQYQKQHFTLTLRQLYYQMVSRALIPNDVKSYKMLGDAVGDGRLTGQIDWDAIEDRSRSVHSLSSWTSPADIVSTCAQAFRIDKWKTQKVRPEVWIEKDALSGVFEGVCDDLQTPYLACKGYTSLSEMWGAAMRLKSYIRAGQEPHIFHFGDHDPSGIDMSRDIEDRLRMFGVRVKFERIALNMPQIKQYKPPPNPAKTSDSRFDSYMQQFGNESWELDALDPPTIEQLVRDAIYGIRDIKKWKAAVKEEDEHKRLLQAVADDWDNLTSGL